MKGIIMSVKEQSFTVPFDGMVKNYDGWRVTCDDDDCENAIIVTKQVVPYVYLDERQLKNGTLNIPGNDVDFEDELAEHLNHNTDWRILQNGTALCPVHSKDIRESIVKKTKSIFDGFANNVEGFGKMVDNHEAFINENGEGIMVDNGELRYGLMPMDGSRKINIGIKLYYPNDSFDIGYQSDFIEADTFEEADNMIMNSLTSAFIS